ncbi:MAG: DUF362 domain-containing protein, partial [Cyclobacteriaceae bacterium]|nr:DUF362 domain-containing protein [Cyclobacteriaceae bacterium]
LNSDGVIVDKILSTDISNVRVAKMVDTAVMKITNKSSVGLAWESLFPAGHPNMNTKIGIKLNLSYGDYRNDLENDWSKIYCPFGPKSAVTNAIVSGLSQMLDGTFPIENITLIERMYSVGRRKYYPLIQGYRPVSENSEGIYKDTQPGAYGIHWIYAANPIELPSDAPNFIAAPDYPEKYRAPQRIYSAVYKNDFLINYAIGKDHRAAGITGAMKNNYGCTDNPMGTHGSEWNNVDSPYAGTRLCVPVFYKNVNQHAPYILHLLDALTGVYHGGPLSGKVFHANTIAVSKDAVAIDSFLLNMINGARRKKGLSLIDTVDGRTPEGHPNASFLRIASENHELGSMSQDNIQSYDLSASTEQYNLPTLQKNLSLISEVRRTKDAYEVHVFLDNSKRNHSIDSRIENMRGKVIKSFKTLTTKSSMATLQWDHRNDDNTSVKEGIYIWYVSVDGILHTGTINDYYNS